MTEGISSHQVRTGWCVRHFGPEVEIHRRALDDVRLRFGIMEFHCRASRHHQAEHWAYVTNGMSERRMPWQEGPTVPENLRCYRYELLALAHRRATWVIDLLAAMACYPFVQRTGFAYGHTLPFASEAPEPWQGCVLGLPPNHDELNPLGIVADALEGDHVLWLHVMGLREDEFDAAVERGGQQVLDQLSSTADGDELFFLDSKRRSLLGET